MDKKSKLILALLLFIIALLAIFVGFISYKVATIENSIHSLASQKQITPMVVNGIDGKDGISIKGDPGSNGNDGQDSLSTSTVIEKTFYTPTAGPEGKAGKDAASQEIRINPETKDLEAKREDVSFWSTIIPCSELLRVCPVETIEAVIGGK